MRRKFTDAEKAAPNGKAGPTLVKALKYCERIFRLEQQLSDMSPEERYKQRQEKLKPILDEFLSWAETRSVTPKSKLGIALTYLKNQMPRFRNILQDGHLESTNNIAERSIKPFVISRKNFLFANTPCGADSSAILFSLIETAKETGLDPCRYLTHVFRTAPKLDMKDPDQVKCLLPENAPADCKV